MKENLLNIIKQAIYDDYSPNGCDFCCGDYYAYESRYSLELYSLMISNNWRIDRLLYEIFDIESVWSDLYEQLPFSKVWFPKKLDHLFYIN